MSFRPLLLGAGAVLALISASACGSSSTPAPVNHNGTQALRKLLEKGVSAERKIGTNSIQILETVNDGQRTIQLGERVVGQLDPPRSESVATTTVSGNDITVRIITIGHTMYLSGGTFAKLIPTGKTWLREPAAKVSAAIGIPDQSSQLLDEVSASSKLTVAGHAVVNGQATTEYRFLLNFDGITAKAAKSSMFGQLAPMLRGVEAPISLWVSGQGLPVREQAHFTFKGATVELVSNMTYGVPVHVTAPPPAQVATAPVSAGSGTTSSGL